MKDVLNYSTYLVSYVSPWFLHVDDVDDVICRGDFFCFVLFFKFSIVCIEPTFVKNTSFGIFVMSKM